VRLVRKLLLYRDFIKALLFIHSFHCSFIHKSGTGGYFKGSVVRVPDIEGPLAGRLGGLGEHHQAPQYKVGGGGEGAGEAPMLLGHFIHKQTQKRPKVFGCAQIISLLNTEQNHLTRPPIALKMHNDGRANVSDPTR
jgi:hypothetical protein